jgi:hypothetical protein
MVLFLNIQVSLVAANLENKYSIIPNLLASEGLELVQGIRDSNFQKYFAGQAVDWDNNLADGIYELDYNIDLSNPATNMTLSTCSVITQNNTCDLNVDANGFYAKGESSNQIKFYRFVEIKTIIVDFKTVKMVTSNVILDYKGKQKVYSAVSNLYNTDI